MCTACMRQINDPLPIAFMAIQLLARASGQDFIYTLTILLLFT